MVHAEACVCVCAFAQATATADLSKKTQRRQGTKMDDTVKKLVRTLGQTWVDFPRKTTLLQQSITSPAHKHRVHPSLLSRASRAHGAPAHSRRTIELAAAASGRSGRWVSARHAHIKASIIHADKFPSLQLEGKTSDRLFMSRPAHSTLRRSPHIYG